jgi:predicted acetyltransferase
MVRGMPGAAAVTLEEVGEPQAGTVERLLQLYLYDFSEIEGLRIDDTGHYRNVSPWTHWKSPHHHAFVVRVDGELAGLVLVKPATDDWSDEPTRIVDEFFIMRKFRRRGVGREVTRRLFDRLPGRWSLNQTQHNYTAQAFWRTVLGEYTGGHFEEVVIDGRPTQRFDTAPKH